MLNEDLLIAKDVRIHSSIVLLLSKRTIAPSKDSSSECIISAPQDRFVQDEL